MIELDYEADITIVGSNAIGAAAALAFVQQGFRVFVLDRLAPNEPPTLQAPAPIGDIAARFLSSLNLDYNFEGAPQIKSWQFNDHNNETILDLMASEAKGPSLEQRFVVPLHLKESLLSRMQGDPRMTLRSGHAAYELHLDDEYSYVVGQTYDHKGFAVRSQFVIDCDDSFSVVNSAIAAPVESLRRARTWLTLLINSPDPGLRCHLGYYQGRPLVRVPLGASAQSWCLAAVEGDRREVLGSREFIGQMLQEVAQIEPQYLEHISLQDYPMSIRTKLWEHRTALIGTPSLHLSEEQAWLADSVLDTGLGDVAALVWPLTGILTEGLTLNALKVWEQKRIAYRRARADRHRIATETVFKSQQAGLIGRLTKRVRQAVTHSHSEDELRSLVLEPTPLGAGPKILGRPGTGIAIPRARIQAAFDASRQIAQDQQTFNETTIQIGFLDKALPPGYVVLSLDFDPEQTFPAESLQFLNDFGVGLIQVNPPTVGPRPRAICDVDGTIAAWIKAAQKDEHEDLSLALITPERYCAAIVSLADSTALVNQISKAYGLASPARKGQVSSA